MFKQLPSHDFYPYKFQVIYSVHCGWYAQYVVKLIEGLNNPSPQMITRALVKVFGKTADVGDEQTLAKFWGVDASGVMDKTLDDLEGSGFFSDIWNRLRGVKQAVTGIRDNLAPNIRNSLSQIGNNQITNISIGRTPLTSKFNTLVNFARNISGLPPTSHDKLFHLFIIFTLSNGQKWTWEKNEIITLKPYVQKPIDQVINLGNKPITLNNWITNAQNKMGPSFYTYNATSTNCQHFVLGNLLANGIQVSTELKNWILQDVSQLLPSWGQRIAKFATDMASKFNLVKEGYGAGIGDWFSKLISKLTGKLFNWYANNSHPQGYDSFFDTVGRGRITQTEFNKLKSHLNINDAELRKRLNSFAKGIIKIM